MNKKCCACKHKKHTKHKATKPKPASKTSKKVTNKLESGRIMYNF